jgi:hypothetical protein
VHVYGLAQTVGPVQPIPPHCPYSCAVEVGDAELVVVDKVVEDLVDVAVLDETTDEDDIDEPLSVRTKVTTEYAGKVALTVPPVTVVAKDAGADTELSI